MRAPELLHHIWRFHRLFATQRQPISVLRIVFGVPAAVAGLFVFPKTGLFRIILPILLSLGSLRLFLTALSVFIISLPIFIIILLSLRLIVLPLLFLALPAIVFRTALRLALLLVLLLLLILILLLLVLLFLLSF